MDVDQARHREGTIEIEDLEDRRRALENEIDSALRDLASAREDLLMRERVLEEARNDVQTLRHELASLEALQQAALGREAREAHDWIEDLGLDKTERLGEVLSVVTGWEQAVETVLGEHLQAIHVESLETFEQALANFEGGGVTLMEATADVHMAGDLPSLASLISSHELKLGSVLQGIFAAESVAVALANRAGLEVGESIITRQGLWVGPDWIRRYAVTEEESGIIQRAQELDTLNLRVEEAEKTLADLIGHLADGRSRIEHVEALRARYSLSV